MNRNYKYTLQKGSKHTFCPNCNKKTFKLYVLASDERIVAGEQFGRCERINSCGYIKYPTDDVDMGFVAPTTKITNNHKPIISPDFVPSEIVEKTFSMFQQNTFFYYLTKLFGITKAYELQEIYNIGTAKNNGTIYWQQDKEGNFRTGKVMYYGTNGKRLKDKNSWYIHRRIKEDFELQQVFFGEHLLSIDEYKDKPIALCESEKTAVIMSEFMPEYVWLASGGANMLNSFRLLRLHKLDKVFPDQSPELFKKWEKQTSIFTNRQMDVSVEKAYKDGIVEAGADILDLELIQRGFR